jgi:hypothetical protein
MSKFFDNSDESFRRRSVSMSGESFKNIRRLQESGAPLPLIVSNVAWQSLLDKIDSNITERSIVLQEAISKLPIAKRALASDSLDGPEGPGNKKQRLDESSGDFAKPEGVDSYEDYRKQCWLQYYDWLDQQKPGSSGATQVASVDGEKKSEQSDRDEDEDIHNALLGLS